MHLEKLPTIFVKGDEERKVYFTIQAKELAALGWTEKKEGKVEEIKAESKPRNTRAKAEVQKEEAPKE